MDFRVDRAVMEMERRISVEPISPQSQHNCGRGEHVMLGISPFNAYFTEERIREFADWGRQNFKALHLFVPDVPSIFTLRAMGYSESRARNKAHRQAKYLVNKIHRALESLGYPGRHCCCTLAVPLSFSFSPLFFSSKLSFGLP